MTAALLAPHTGRHGKPSRASRIVARWRTTDGRERDDTRSQPRIEPAAKAQGCIRGTTGDQKSLAAAAGQSPGLPGATALRGAQPPAPGPLRRCRIAAFWLLAVLGDWRLNWRTWREDRRDGTDLASARIWLDRLRGIGPLTAARTRLAAVRAVVPAALPAATPGHHEDPHVTVTGEVAAAALPCEPLYPVRNGEFTALIGQMTPPAHVADEPLYPVRNGEFTALIGQMTPPAHVAGQF